MTTIPLEYLQIGGVVSFLVLIFMAGRWIERYQAQFERCPVCNGSGKICWEEARDTVTAIEEAQAKAAKKAAKQ